MNTIVANRLAMAVLLLVGLSACDNDKVGTVTESSDGGSRFEMIPPQRIALSRAVDPAALIIEVTVNGVNVPMETNNNGVRTGNIQLQEGAELPVKVKWSELIENAEPLDLALAEKDISVRGNESGNQDFIFESDEFNYSIFDDDDDGRSNFRERTENTDPRDVNDPGLPLIPVSVIVRIQLPDDRVLENNELLGTITPVATVNGAEIVLGREGNSWVGKTEAAQNSSAFTEVTFYQQPDRLLVLATARFSKDVANGGNENAFNFAASDFEFEQYDADSDNLSNLGELLDGFDPLDSNSPAQDPCATSNFALGCTIDTDEDGKPDSQETETLDTDQDGRPNYLESSLEDNDQDGRNAELDIDDADPCIPSATNAACVTQQTDTDLDGKTDAEEGDVDTDEDGIPDFQESAILDEDSDGVFDELDIDNADPCIPSETNAACTDSQTDTDLDGKSDVEEGTVDTDGDGIPDFRESAILDEDDDGVFDELDVENADPCIPSETSAACIASQTDTDLDGKSDVEEGTVDTDGDGIPDFRESAILDEDDDGVFDELDIENADPCIPSETNEACAAVQLDSDSDGKTDAEEGTADSDGDGIPDYLESAILDEDADGEFDEDDIENSDPCIPSTLNPACELLQLDTDMDGETDAEEGLGDSDGDEIPDYLESDILDFDEDTFSDEVDPANEDPCVPSELTDACGIVQRDSDDDGKTDLEEGDTDTDGDSLPDYLESAILDLDMDGVVDELDPVNGDPCIPLEDSPACLNPEIDSSSQ